MAGRSVAGVFSARAQAENAVQQLESSGFSDENVSLVGRDESGGRSTQNARQPSRQAKDQSGTNMSAQQLGNGSAWGAGLGAGAGIMASMGALAIPGIGPLIAMGPLAATLGGAAAGGLAGGLVDLGIPEQAGKEYENDVKTGKFLAVVHDADDVGRAESMLRDLGAQKVRRF